MSASTSIPLDAGSHGPCLERLGQLGAVGRAHLQSADARLSAADLLRLPSQLNAGGLARLLGGAVALNALALPASLAAMLATTRKAGRLFTLPRGGPGPGLGDPLAPLRARIDALRNMAARRPPVDPVAALPALNLMSATSVFEQHRINIFAPGAGATLAAYVERLRAGDLLRGLTRPGAPPDLLRGLDRHAGAAEGLRLLEGLRGAGPPGTSPLQFLPERMLQGLSAIQAGPIGLLSLGAGRQILPETGELARISAAASMMGLERQFAQTVLRLVPKGPRGAPADPFAALDRNGVCAMLRDLPDLKAAAAGASATQTTSHGLQALRRGYGVDLREADAAPKLERALERLSSAQASVPTASTDLLRSEHAIRANTLVEALTAAALP